MIAGTPRHSVPASDSCWRIASTRASGGPSDGPSSRSVPSAPSRSHSRSWAEAGSGPSRSGGDTRRCGRGHEPMTVLSGRGRQYRPDRPVRDACLRPDPRRASSPRDAGRDPRAMPATIRKGRRHHGHPPEPNVIRTGPATDRQGEGGARREERVERAPASAEAENEFIRLHGFDEYAKWHLGIDDEEHERTKGRYRFPDGDFKKVHRLAVLAAESRAWAVQARGDRECGGALAWDLSLEAMIQQAQASLLDVSNTEPDPLA